MGRLYLIFLALVALTLAAAKFDDGSKGFQSLMAEEKEKRRRRRKDTFGLMSRARSSHKTTYYNIMIGHS